MPLPLAPSHRKRGAAALLIALAFTLVAVAPARGAKLEEGQKAAGLKGTDFLTGAPLDLDQFLGKRVILLDFGSIYCSSCMVTVPNLIKLRKKYPEENLAIFNIYLDIYNPQRVIKFFRGFAKDISLNLLIDLKLAISREYGVDTLPTTIIIDRGGVIRRRIVGYTEADEKEIDGVIEKLINEMPVSGSAGERRGEEPFTVFVPESFTKTSQDRVALVGYTGGAGSRDVSLKLNNLPERVVTAKDNVFHFQTPLSLAMNLIEIKGQAAAGTNQNQSIVIFRETLMGGDINSDLPEYKFHRDEEKKPCNKCHKLEVPLQDKSGMGQINICSACHTGLSKRIFTHGPITVGGCLPCHDYQSFPNKYELRAQGAELCYSCHDQVREQVGKASFIHGPVAAGYCVVCHDPHGANERFLLVRKADRLCVSCHQDMLTELAKPYVHKPIEQGSCTGCHNPHASNESKFLVQPRATLCEKCHDFSGQRHLHKIGIMAKTAFPPGTPLSEEGQTTCYTCHYFHASNQVKLTRGPKAQCGLGCHETLGGEAPAGESNRDGGE
ncbi:MAG: cytochrome c3 family protein [Candidatus Methylomirabilia bacterium]